MRDATFQELCGIAKSLLIAIGEDPNRPGLQDTPRRFADWWLEFIRYEPGTLDTTFETTTTNQMVVVSPIRVWSLCEHHLLPFWGDVSIGYIARDRVLGLSKFARIAHKHAHSLQLQERLADQIANEINEVTGSNDVAVHIRGEHLCMTMRGIKTPAVMQTSVMRGVFFEKPEARQEFFSLIRLGS